MKQGNIIRTLTAAAMLLVTGFYTEGKESSDSTSVRGAAATLFEEDLTNRSATDAGAALQGKVSGLLVMNPSGAPGETSKLRLRGFTTSSGNGGPLLIVDGLKVENIQYLDPSLIEKVEILKDAAATALYGIHGGNGVIRITTRQGTGKVSVGYSFKLTTSSLGRKADLQNAQEWTERLKREGMELADLDGTDTDWSDVVYGNGLTHQHGLSIQGGNERGSFHAAVNYLDENGIVKGDKDTYDRLSVLVNGNYTVTDWMKIGINASFNNRNTSFLPQQMQYSSVFRSVNTMTPVTPSHYSSPEEFHSQMYLDYLSGRNFLKDPSDGRYYAVSRYGVLSDNPLILMDKDDMSIVNQDMRGSLYARFTPLKGLSLTARAGYRNESHDRRKSSIPYYASSFLHSYTYSLSVAERHNIGYQADVFAEYILDRNRHSLDIQAGAHYENLKQEFRDAEGISQTGAVGYDDLLFTGFTDKEFSHSDLGLYAQAGYVFDDRYSITAAFRTDKYRSDRLNGEDDPWLLFPSLSAGWNIAAEPFFRGSISSNVISLLKIRGSWGKGGNTSDFEAFWNPIVSPDRPTCIETSEHADIGIDAALFKGRLEVTADWFSKNTEGIFMNNYLNNTVISNTGIETDISWKDRIGNFSYRISGNLSSLSNKVVTLNADEIYGISGPESNGPRTMFTAGEPMWVFYHEGEILGQGIPELYYGMTAGFAYKGFDLNIYGSGISGNDISYSNHPGQGYIYGNLLRHYAEKRWEMIDWKSSDAIFDGSYFKIRQIQLGFTIPERITRRIFMRNARVFISFDDFFTFSSYPGGDPETVITDSMLTDIWTTVYSGSAQTSSYGTDSKPGCDTGSYPSSRKVVFGLSVNF